MAREIVRKPWGFEYVYYKSDEVAVLHLRILSGDATSLHCHPSKKTAMLFLRGSGTVRFLNSQVTFRAPFHMIIRPGLFHQIAATNDEDLECLEIESPPDPYDLVRLEDSYGRENSGYENSVLADDAKSATTIALVENHVAENEWVSISHDVPLFQGRFRGVETLASQCAPSSSIVILSGKLMSDEGHVLLGPSDIVSGTTVRRLAARFQTSTSMNVLSLANGYGE